MKEFPDQKQTMNRPASQRCRFFFCRIARFPQPFIGMFNKERREENREFRSCQKSLREGKRSARKARRAHRNKPTNQTQVQNTETTVSVTNDEKQPIVSGSKCEQLRKLYDKYQVDNNEALIYALNKTLLDSFKVKTMEQLQDTINKLNIRKLELSYLNKTIDFEDYKYYVYNNSRLGWSNVDI